MKTLGLNVTKWITRRRLVRLLDGTVWISFLLLVIAISFTFGGYGTESWLALSGYFYLWLCYALISVGAGVRVNLRALRSAKPIILLMSLSLLWVWLPLFIPYKHALYDMIAAPVGIGLAAPDWYQPDSTWSTTPERTRWLLMSEFFIFCLFLSSLALINSRQRLKQFLVLLMFVGMGHALIGLFGQYARIIFVDVRQVDGHFDVARGLFVNRNHYAAFLVIALMSGLAFQWRLMLKSKNSNFRGIVTRHFNLRHLMVLVVIMTMLAGIVSSQSRGPLLSLVAALVLAFMMTDSIVLSNRRIVVLPLLILSAVAFIYFGQELIARFGGSALSLGERWDQWLITFKAIRANILFGYGGGSYITVFQIFRDQADLRDVIFAQSHNHYLHIWLERGLIGLSMWLAAFGLILYRAKTLLSKVKSDLVSGVIFASLTVVLAALIQSLVDFNLQLLNIRVYFFLIVALIYASPHIKHNHS